MNTPLRSSVLVLLAFPFAAAASADVPKAAPQAPPQAPSQPAPKFLIGVWDQPVSTFEKWKARGINTLVGSPHDSGPLPRHPRTDSARTTALSSISHPSHAPQH